MTSSKDIISLLHVKCDATAGNHFHQLWTSPKKGIVEQIVASDFLFDSVSFCSSTAAVINMTFCSFFQPR